MTLTTTSDHGSLNRAPDRASSASPWRGMLKAAPALAGLVLCGAAVAGPITVKSSSFTEHGMMASRFAGECGGQSVSPQVSWSDLPAAAKSVAVFMADPDGALGLGVSHWVVYNIDAARGQLKEGEAQTTVANATLGKNSAGATVYRGMCPPVGDLSHHYVLTVVASDLEPTALPPGLTRDELLVALKGHALGGQSTIGLYSR
jgi:Raf kinase inhibitor-like YbhB/YbcL family protein